MYELYNLPLRSMVGAARDLASLYPALEAGRCEAENKSINRHRALKSMCCPSARACAAFNWVEARAWILVTSWNTSL